MPALVVDYEFYDLIVVAPDRVSHVGRHVKARPAVLDVRVFPGHGAGAKCAAPGFVGNRVTNVVFHVLSLRRC